MKTTAYSFASSAETASRYDQFESMIEERNRQRSRLTPRELDVLRLLCEGLPNKLIERRLGIGAGTVKCHVASILSKLGVASRLQAVVAAHKHGLLESASPEAASSESVDYPIAAEPRTNGPVTLTVLR